MPFQIVQVFYWLALSTWFGGLAFVAVASQVILRTLREMNPVLPDVLSVNLEGQHGTLVGSTIVSNLLTTLVRVDLICAAALTLALLAQWFLIDLQNGSVLTSAIVRSVLLVAAVLVMVYDWRQVWPRVLQYRKEYLDHADEPDRANPAMDSFNRYQRESFMLLNVELCLLLGIVLFSSTVLPAPTFGLAGK